MPMDKEALAFYYEHIFPTKFIFDWLSYGSENNARCREISFAFDEIVKRFLAFSNVEAFQSELRRSIPSKIDIGAIFSHPPDKKASFSIVPQQRELVFDIDISDYNNVRDCCGDTSICQYCWPFMTAAIRTISALLTNDFGYVKFFWVYSGRRGVHCWVCDVNARLLTDIERSAVVQYINVYEGGPSGFAISCEKELRSTKHWLHPSIQLVLEEVLYDTFRVLFFDQENPNCLQRSSKTATVFKQLFLNYLSKDARLGKAVDSIIGMILACKSLNELQKIAQSSGFEWALDGVVLATCYPRIDINVSKMRNHLLKAPWVVHPATGRVCVPIALDKCDEFDPLTDAPLAVTLVDSWKRGEPVDLSPWLNLMNL